MNLYVVTTLDRHKDPDIELYTDRGAAIARAQQIAADNDRHNDLEVIRDMGDWLYYAKWGHEEADYVFVVQREVQP